MTEKGRIVLAGGSGFIGAALSRALQAAGYSVVVLSRSAKSEPDTVLWDGQTLGPWRRSFENAAGVINLSGKSINCLFTEDNKKLILSSRLNSVRVIAQAIAQCSNPPPVWLQASAVGIYGSRGEEVCQESSSVGDDFLARVCRTWEQEFFCENSVPINTRRVALRMGMVLGPGGGALLPLARLTRCFFGGAAGTGRQFISWVHIADLGRIFLEALENQNFVGCYNACSPNPVSNEEFMATLRHVLRRPWSPAAPSWAVRFGARYLLRTEASLALEGQRCLPEGLMELGFGFRYPQLEEALEEIL